MKPNIYLIDKYLNGIKKYFKVTGINTGIDKRTGKTRIYFWMLYLFSFLWVNIVVCGEICWIIDGVRRKKEFTDLTFVVPCATITILSNMKAIFLVVQENLLVSHVEDLRELEDIEVDYSNTYPASEINKEKIKMKESDLLRFVVNFLNLFYVLTPIGFAISPLVLMTAKYMKTNKIELILPFLVLWPVDPYQMNLFPWAYLHQLWAETLVVIKLGGVDCIFFSCSTFISIQFKLLKYDLQLITNNLHNVRCGGMYYEDQVLKKRLTSLILRHQKIIKSVHTLQKIFSKSTLVNFIFSSFLICLSGFNIMAQNDLAPVIVFFSFLIMSVNQIFLFCFFGDMILKSSEDVGHGVYTCHWYMCDKHFCNKLRFIQLRALTPCKISAAGFVDVSISAFTKVLRSAWSYFALLQTLYTPSS